MAVNLPRQREELFYIRYAWGACIWEHMLLIHLTHYFEYHIFTLWQPYVTDVIWPGQSGLHPQRWENKGVTYLWIYRSYIACYINAITVMQDAHVWTHLPFFHTTNAHICSYSIRYSLAKGSSHTKCKVQMIIPCHRHPEGSQHSHFTELNTMACIIF